LIAHENEDDEGTVFVRSIQLKAKALCFKANKKKIKKSDFFFFEFFKMLIIIILIKSSSSNFKFMFL
jgi:hypothetical protein